MGVLQRFERRLESLVNRPFARIFKAEVQPVEVAAALQRECDQRAAVVARGRTMVPNAFVVELGEHDSARLTPYAEPLSAELAAMVREHAEAQGYTFVGPVEVRFEQHDELGTGVFRVRSQAQAGTTRPGTGPERGQQAPAGAPPARPGPSSADAPTMVGTPLPAGRRLSPYVELKGAVVALTGPTTVVGRGTEADLRVDDPGVSRRHARIVQRDDELLIEDLGSTNGVVVDGERVDRAVLRDGAEVRLGSTTFVVRTGEGA